jgi:hypothetical protein
MSLLRQSELMRISHRPVIREVKSILAKSRQMLRQSNKIQPKSLPKLRDFKRNCHKMCKELGPEDTFCSDTLTT